MNLLRKILVPFLLIPLGMFVYVLVYPDWQWENPGFEYLFLLIGIPILIANFVVWFQPTIITAYFPLRDDWGAGNERFARLAVVISTLLAFIFTGVTVVPAAYRVSARPMPEPTAALPATVTAFAFSVTSTPDPTDQSRTTIISIPTRSPVPETEVALSQTPQIPVSGGVPMSSITLVPTQTGAPAVLVQATNTVGPSTRCSPATSEYLEGILDAVLSAEPLNQVGTGWMVQSSDQADLWFVAARILTAEPDPEAALPGVWAFIVYEEGDFEIYSINDVAQEYSDAAWGEDSDPVITMQNDGAQAAYDCALTGG